MHQLHGTNARNVGTDGPREDCADLKHQGEKVHLEAYVGHGFGVDGGPVVAVFWEVARDLCKNARDYL